MSFDKWVSIFKGAAIAAAGAALAYLTDAIPGVDAGPFTPVLVAGWSVVVNIIRKALESAS